MGILGRLARLVRAEISHARSAEERADLAADAVRRRMRAGEEEPPPPARPSPEPDLRRAYAALEVPYGSDRATVKSAYRALMRKYHPDLHGGDPERQRVASELSVGLTRAYEELERALK